MFPADTEINPLLSEESNALGVQWQLLETVDSTNTDLLRQWDAIANRVVVQIAAEQTAGRGRQGDRWLGESGSHLFMSLHWPWKGENFKAPLSLLTAKAVAQALRLLVGSDDIMVKWPNDLWVGRSKLAGFLLESQSTDANPNGVIIGLGLNLKPLNKALKAAVNRPTIALSELGELPDLAVIVAAIVNAVVQSALLAERSGFEVALADWRSVDACYGRSVVVSNHGRELAGIASGISAHGELLLETQEGRVNINSGSLLFVD